MALAGSAAICVVVMPAICVAVMGALRGTRPVAVAVHRGPADAAPASALVEAIGPDAIVLGEPPLPALAGVLASAALYLGNDSGVSHLAATVGAPEDRKTGELFRLVEPEDLLKFGLIPEFVGRLPVVATASCSRRASTRSSIPSLPLAALSAPRSTRPRRRS